jgi:hypothetical protein
MREELCKGLKMAKQSTMIEPLYVKLYEATETDQSVSTGDISAALQSTDHLVQWIGCKAAGMSRSLEWVGRLTQLAAVRIPADNPDVNSVAVWALAQIGGQTVDEVWRAGSTDPMPERRRVAADLIGELRSLGAVDMLTRLLLDDDLQVVSWASLSASKLGQAGFDLLSRELAKTRDTRRFLYFADALLKIDASAAHVTITSTLQGWAPDHRQNLEKLITQLGTTKRHFLFNAGLNGF